MFLHIDGDKVEVVDAPGGKKHKAEAALARVKDELCGVIEYKKLARDASGKYREGYETASAQEFKHMLMALSDFADALLPEMSAEERVEWKRFLSSAPDGSGM